MVGKKYGHMPGQRSSSLEYSMVEQEGKGKLPNATGPIVVDCSDMDTFTNVRLMTRLLVAPVPVI